MKRIILWLLLCWLPLQAFAAAGVHSQGVANPVVAKPNPACHTSADASTNMDVDIQQHHHDGIQTSKHDCCSSSSIHPECRSDACGLACQVHCAASLSMISNTQLAKVHAFTPPILGVKLPIWASITTPPPTKPPRA